MAILGAVHVSIGLDLPVSSVKIDHKNFYYIFLFAI
jgi:hypothetical protein